MALLHGSAKASIIAIQLIALLLLQVYFLAPAFLKMAKPSAVGKCFGNHRLCGCPPERIANKTCCCFAEHSCCMRGDEACAPFDSVPDTGGAVVQNSPCGLFSDSGMLSLDKLKFLAVAPSPAMGALAAPRRFTPFSEKFEDRLLEPPDPPPRNVVPV